MPGEDNKAYAFRLTELSIRQAILATQAMAEPKANSPVRAINMSFNVNPELVSDPVPALDGNSAYSAAVDYLAAKKDTLFVFAKGNSGEPTSMPVDGYNSLVVGALKKRTYDRVFEETDFSVAANDRRLIHVLAPGWEIDLAINDPNGNGDYTVNGGTSYAAPHVTGAVALLQEYAGANKQRLGNEVQRHEVMKAVIINSAEKVKDRLGADKTVTKTDGTTWDKSDARDEKGNEAKGQALPLDVEMGAGAVDVTRAKKQLEERFQPAGAVRKPIAWDYGTASRQQAGGTAEVRYLLPKLKGGSWVSATLTWDRSVDLNDKPGGTANKYDAGETFTPKALANLDLYLVKKGDDPLTKAVWASKSTDYNVEHIFFQLDKGDDEYELVVLQNSVGDTQYAIAWWTEATTATQPPNPKKLGGCSWNDQDQDGVRDAEEPVFRNVRVDLYDATTSAIIETRYTDSNGEYEFTVDETGQYYTIFIPPTGYTFSPQNVSGNTLDTVDSDVNSSGRSHTVTSDSPFQDWDIDSGMYLTPGSVSIGDRVWEDLNADGDEEVGEPGVSGVSVILRDMNNNLIRSTTTGTNGFYTFSNVDPGDYNLEFIPNSGYQFSTSPVRYISTVAGDVITDVNAGLYRPANIGDRVWLDANGDGVQNATEVGLASVRVELISDSGSVVSSTFTDAAGGYEFAGLRPGSYSLRFSAITAGYAITPKDQGGDDTLDSDADPTTGRTDLFSLTSGQSANTWDAGFRQLFTRLSGVYALTGIYPGQILVAVSVVSTGPGTDLTWTYTLTNDGFGPADPSGYDWSEAQTSFWAIADGPVPATIGPSGWTGHTWDYLGSTGLFWSEYPSYLPGFESVTLTFKTADVPIVLGAATFGSDTYGEVTGDLPVPSSVSTQPTGTVTGNVWVDLDRDGVREAGEGSPDDYYASEIGNFYGGFRVQLVDAATGATVAETYTLGADGSYTFAGVAPGTYRVVVTVFNLFLGERDGSPFSVVGRLSPPDAGADDIDSDFAPIVVDGNGSVGQTAAFAVAGRQTASHLDAGVWWYDPNANFANEPGVFWEDLV